MPTQDKNLKWIVGPLITVVVVSLGFAGSWFTVKADVGELRADTLKIESRVDQHHDDLSNIKIKDAEQSQIVKNVSQSLSRIEEQTQNIPQIQADLEVLKGKVK